MNLNKKQIQYLKGQAHSLKPVVLLGSNGLTEGVVAEIDAACDSASKAAQGPDLTLLHQKPVIQKVQALIMPQSNST